MGYLAGVGALESGIATIFAAGEQDKRLQELQDIANTPGVDVNALTGQAIANQQQYLPQAGALQLGIGRANQTTLSAQEEAALPGVGAARQNALGQINSLFGDQSAWLQGVQRRGAALGLSSGLFGSQAGQLQTLRLSDQEQMQRTQLGTGLLGSLIGGLRIANTPGVQSFLGPDANQLINIRSQERTQRMNMLQQRAGLPTGNELIFQHMQQEGGMLEGFGLSSMDSTGGFMGGGRSGGFGGGNSGYIPPANYSRMGQESGQFGGVFNDYGGELSY